MSDSYITKKAIAHGFKELLKEKGFDKITIQDITRACGLNRQTFYYHFQDKYELVDWIFYNEAISLISEELTYENWNQKVLLLLHHMKEESHFYVNMLKISMESGFQEYLFRVTKELFGNLILQIYDQIETEEIEFIASFYAFGISGTIIFWARNGMKESPEELVSQLRFLSEGTQKFAASRYLTNHSKDLTLEE